MELTLELEARTAPPDHRYGWFFTGGELVDEGIATVTAKAAERTGIAHPMARPWPISAMRPSTSAG